MELIQNLGDSLVSLLEVPSITIVLWWMLEILLVFYVFIFLLPLWPGAIDSLVNNPNRKRPDGENNLTYDKSTFGYFTYLTPGRAKHIESGGRFIRSIMHYAKRRWNGDTDSNNLTQRDPEFWRVVFTDVKAALREKDSHPLPFPIKNVKDAWDNHSWWFLYSPFSIVWWIWKRWVYILTGAIFTGPWPWRYVRVYPHEHFKRVTTEQGEPDLERIRNYSDHYRVAEFQFPVKVPSADTSNFFSVRLTLNIVAQVVAPYDTAYNTDDEWSSRLISSVTSAANNFTRSRVLKEVLAAKDGGGAAVLGETIRDAANTAMENIGIVILRVEVLDISPTDSSVSSRLADEAFAEVEMRAAQLRAKGNAAPLYEQGAALAANPEAMISVGFEAMVRTAAENAKQPGNFTILGGGKGSAIDPKTIALIHELRKLKQEGNSAPATDGQGNKKGDNI